MEWSWARARQHAECTCLKTSTAILCQYRYLVARTASYVTGECARGRCTNRQVGTHRVWDDTGCQREEKRLGRRHAGTRSHPSWVRTVMYKIGMQEAILLMSMHPGVSLGLVSFLFSLFVSGDHRIGVSVSISQWPLICLFICCPSILLPNRADFRVT